MQGMAMVMKVGDPDNFPIPPKFHPKCGGYSYYKSKSDSQCDGNDDDKTSGCARSSVVGFLIAVIVALLLAWA